MVYAGQWMSMVPKWPRQQQPWQVTWMVSFINNHWHQLAGPNHGNISLVYVGFMTFNEPIDGLMIDDMKKFILNINWLMGLIVGHDGLQVLHSALSSLFFLVDTYQYPSSDLSIHREHRMVFNCSSRAATGASQIKMPSCQHHLPWNILNRIPNSTILDVSMDTVLDCAQGLCRGVPPTWMVLKIGVSAVSAIIHASYGSYRQCSCHGSHHTPWFLSTG